MCTISIYDDNVVHANDINAKTSNDINADSMMNYVEIEVCPNLIYDDIGYGIR